MSEVATSSFLVLGAAEFLEQDGDLPYSENAVSCESEVLSPW